LTGFLPPGYERAAQDAVAAHVTADAAQSGAVAIVAGLLALAVLAARIGAVPATRALVLLLSADLLRTGAGLNPEVEPSLFRLSEEIAQRVPDLRRAGRLLSCAPQASAGYWQARARRPGAHDVWTFATHLDTLTPNANLLAQVPSAFSEDLTSLVPVAMLPPPGWTCSRLGEAIERLRASGVARVLSLDTLVDPAVRPLWVAAPARIAPLVIHGYELSATQPRAAVLDATGRVAMGRVLSIRESTDRIELDVEAEGAATVVLRDGFAPGWSASVDGRPASVHRVEQRYRAVDVSAGSHTVDMRYRPPGLGQGLLAMGVSLAVAAALWMSGRRSRHERGGT
jgi:hypothetical protein